MKCFVRKVLLVAIVATFVATSFIYADTVPKTEINSDWVYIEAKKNFMFATVFSDGSVVATKDKCFESTFNGKRGCYATDQEGYMIKGYVFYNNNLYYFLPGGVDVGKLLSNSKILYNGKQYEVDAYGKIHGDLKDIIENAKVYTMGLYKGD